LNQQRKIDSGEYEGLSPEPRKKICWEQQGRKCNHCGYDKLDLKTGPYQLHHIDGNPRNHKRENEEILCCNCHYMTDNYGHKNRKHTNESRKKMSISLNKQKECNQAPIA